RNAGLPRNNAMSQDPPSNSRRQFLATSTVLGAAGALWSSLPFASASAPAHINHSGGPMTADLILFNGRFHTVDPEKPTASAVAVKDGRFLAVGSDADVMAYRSDATHTLDLNKRTVVPGLNDS